MSNVGKEPTFKFVEDELNEDLCSNFLALSQTLRVQCSMCPTICSLSSFQDHKKVCDGVVCECGGKLLGCEFSCPRRDLPSHEKECQRFVLSPAIASLNEQMAMFQRSMENINRGVMVTLQKSPFSGVESVKFPLPDKTPTKLKQFFDGYYRLGAEVWRSEDRDYVSFQIRFLEGPFDDMNARFPFKGKVTVSLLSPTLKAIRSLTLDTANVGFQEFCSRCPSKGGWGWQKFASLEIVEKYLDGNKMWFSVNVEEE